MRNRTTWQWLAGALGFSLLISACAAQPAPSSMTSAPLPQERGPAPTSSAGGAAPAPATRGNSGDTALPSDQAIVGIRKIIYTGDMNLEVKTPIETMTIVSRLVQDNGGYVATSNTTNQNDKQIVTMSLRVPAEAYNDTMSQLRKLGDKVRDEKTTSQDVSEEYADLSAQLRNLEASEAQYLEFMKRAQTIDEVLKVQQQLTTVRGQIERIKGRLTFLDRRSDLATINLGLYAPAATPTRTGGYANPLEAAVEAWDASLRFLSVAASGVVALVVFFWWAIPPMALLAFWIVSRLRRRRVPTPTPTPA
ncbi:MAG: DUF4349 domain-containing protein [Dehalococcoidia bacterium]